MRRRTIAAVVGAASTLLVAMTASADPPKPGPAAFGLNASPIFGHDAATGYGWTEIVARLDNGATSSVKGDLELVSSMSYGHEQEFTTRAPFNVPPGRSVIVHVPTHGYPYQPATLTVTAVGDGGAKLATMTVNVNGAVAPVLVDVDEPSRLSLVLRNITIPTTWSPGGGGYGGSTPAALTVGVAAFDGTTGDPILPEHAAAYASATVVLIHSDALARLEAAPLDALVDWVLSGGTLAVVPTRPEDLRGPTLTALAGGTVSTAEAPPVLLTLPALAPAPSSHPFGAPPPPPDEETRPTPKAPPALIGPSAAVRGRLVGYAGGNLHASRYGASATYGTGEVHLLAFDPAASPVVDDPWVQARLVDLVAHAWDRRAVNVYRQGLVTPSTYQLNDVRRSLDPNENFRPALGIAAILLVLYSIVAGPITFLRAGKRGSPLSPLKWAPVWSAATFAAVVLIGLAGKGWRGRARHLSLIEAGAGVSRGSIRRFRGFFTSEAHSMSIPTTDATCVLDVTSDESSSREHRVFRIDRNGGVLESLTSLPWETVVVVEDGFSELGSGLTVLAGPDGGVDVVNRTGHALRDLVVYAPGNDLVYFAEVADGATISSAKGRSMGRVTSRRSTVAGGRVVHPLDAAQLGTLLDPATYERLRDEWRPIENAAGNDVDWLPDDAPVVLAEIVSGGGRAKDSGLSVERDRTLLRVVGSGGTR